jgi:hypothetical protein
MNETDPLAAALSEVATPPLDQNFAARVRARAFAELAPAPSQAGLPVRLRVAVSGALVPALLVSAAVTRTAQTIQVAAKIYGHRGGG